MRVTVDFIDERLKLTTDLEFTWNLITICVSSLVESNGHSVVLNFFLQNLNKEFVS